MTSLEFDTDFSMRDFLKKLCPTAKELIIKGIDDHKEEIFIARINTKLRLSHFMAQIAHESAGFRTTKEFASGKAYEFRTSLGNLNPGDGERYKGRGLIQITGRANYRDLIVLLKFDFESFPEKLEEFPYALQSAIEFWNSRNLNAYADKDNLEAITRKINGGLNGLEDRKRYLNKAKILLNMKNEILRLSDEGPEVRRLQFLLKEMGYKLVVDGVFGNHTKEALTDFQKRHGLVADGVAGDKTWGALNER